MATSKISALPTIGVIDRAADFLEVVDSSAGTSNKVTPNGILGITGTPVGTIDTQALTNKTLGNTNTITVKDASFTLQDDADTTKQANFQLSGITTGTTRTYTMPNANVTLASLTGTETLTNKTLTSPTITGGTIDNTTITVDSIAGHTSSTIVTVAGLQISSGKLNTNNSVVTANITDAAVTPAKLQSGTGSGWSWSSWTPTYANITVGNGTVVSRYIQTGKTVEARYSLVLGTTSVIGSSPQISLPVTARADYVAGAESYGYAQYLDSGTNIYGGALLVNSTTTAIFYVVNAAGTYTILNAATAAIPFVFGSTDAIFGYIKYEAA